MRQNILFGMDENEIEKIRFIVEETLRNLGANPQDNLWVTGTEAERILGVGKTQLYLLRTNPNSGIVFSQANRKNIMYLKKSLYDYLEKNIVK